MFFGGPCHEGPDAPLSPVATAQTEAAPTAAIRVSRKRFAQDSPAKLALWRSTAVVLPPMQRILLAACVLLVLALEACASDDTAAVSRPAMRTTAVEDWQSAPSAAPRLRQSEITLGRNWPTTRLRD